MEKIAIGVPYEISIEPSIDIGDFTAEIVLELDASRIGVELKKIKGQDIDYSFIVPSELKSLFKKNTVDYSIFVYKENARFAVDDGKIKFIDEKDFKVRVTDNVKMRPSKAEEEPEKEKPEDKKKPAKKDAPKPSTTPSEAVKERYIDPEQFAQSLIEKEAQKATSVNPQNKVVERSPEPTPMPRPQTTRPDPSKGNLHAILNSIETQQEKDARRKKINESIQKGLKK